MLWLPSHLCSYCPKPRSPRLDKRLALTLIESTHCIQLEPGDDGHKPSRRLRQRPEVVASVLLISCLSLLHWLARSPLSPCPSHSSRCCRRSVGIWKGNEMCVMLVGWMVVRYAHVLIRGCGSKAYCSSFENWQPRWMDGISASTDWRGRMWSNGSIVCWDGARFSSTPYLGPQTSRKVWAGWGMN